MSDIDAQLAELQGRSNKTLSNIDVKSLIVYVVPVIVVVTVLWFFKPNFIMTKNTLTGELIINYQKLAAWSAGISLVMFVAYYFFKKRKNMVKSSNIDDDLL